MHMSDHAVFGLHEGAVGRTIDQLETTVASVELHLGMKSGDAPGSQPEFHLIAAANVKRLIRRDQPFPSLPGEEELPCGLL